MKYTVTYRTQTGRLESQVFDAESRPALFTILKQKGITAVRINEGAIPQAKPRLMKINRTVALVLAVSIALSAGLAVILIGRDTKPVPVKKAVPKIIKSNLPKSPKVETEKPERTDSGMTMKKNPRRMEKGSEVISSSVQTNSSGAVIERLKLADGRTIRKIHPPKPIFENPSDQLIAMAISVKPGESMPPLPLDSSIENDFLKSLLNPIVINDDDPRDIKELKARVMETRAYLADEIKAGGTVLEALKAHQSEMQMMSDATLMAVREMQKVREESGEEEAKLFAERINESFRVRGLPEIPVPGSPQKNEQPRRRNAK